MRSAEDERIIEPGWYFYDSEYPEEGSCGPYVTRDAAAAAAFELYERVEDSYGVFYFNGSKISPPPSAAEENP